MMARVRKIWMKNFFHTDEGWTFIEATFSIVLISVVFLGFSITLLNFREWMNRSWAIRCMDQYANDFMSHLDNLMQYGTNMGTNPNQYGLGSFWISITNFNQYPFEVLDSTLYSFSAKPTEGIFVAAGNSAPVPFDQDFPLDEWKYKHRFTIEDFHYEPFFELNRPPLFNQAMGQVYLTIRYERLGGLDFLSETFMDEYSIVKEYRIATFMKNHVDQPE